jgi:hypothetical protein
MEEDIKSSIMRLYKSITYRYWYAEQDKDIENLINEYGKLEEQIDKHVYFETTNPKEIEKNYIPKTKIKEKIEELNIDRNAIKKRNRRS